MNESIFQQPLRPEHSQNGNENNAFRQAQNDLSESFDPPSINNAGTGRESHQYDREPIKKPSAAPFSRPAYLSTGAFKALSVSIFVEGIFSLILSIVYIILMFVFMAALPGTAGRVIVFLIGCLVFVSTFLNFILGTAALKLRKGNPHAARTVSSIMTFRRVILFILVGILSLTTLISLVTLGSILPLLSLPIPLAVLLLCARYLQGIREAVRQIGTDLSTTSYHRYFSWVRVSRFAWFFAGVSLISAVISALSSSSTYDLFVLLNDLGIEFGKNLSFSEKMELRELLNVEASVTFVSAISSGYYFIRFALIAVCHKQLLRAHNAASSEKASLSKIYPASASMPSFMASVLWIASFLIMLSDTHNTSGNLFSMIRYIPYDNLSSVYSLVGTILSYLSAVGMFLLACAHLSCKAESTALIGCLFMLSNSVFSIIHKLYLSSIDIYIYFNLAYSFNIISVLIVGMILICAILGLTSKKRAPLAVRIIAPIVIGTAIFSQIIDGCSFRQLVCPISCLFTSLVLVNCRKRRVSSSFQIV